jgi:hypothetical protein
VQELEHLDRAGSLQAEIAGTHDHVRAALRVEVA